MKKKASAPLILLGLILYFSASFQAIGASAQTKVDTAKTVQKNTLSQRIQTAYDKDPPTDPKQELALLEPLMAEARATKDIDADDFANLSLIYALALYHNDRVLEAYETINRALIYYESKNSGDTDQLSDLLKNKAIYLNMLGRTDEAIETQKRALGVMTRRGKADSPQAGTIMASLAFAYGKTGRLKESLDTYEMAVTRLRPENGAAAAMSGQLGNYANQLNIAGDYEKALVMSKKSLDVATEFLPQSHRAVRWAYSKHADQLVDIGRYSEAEIYSRKAYELAVTHTGKISGETGTFSYNLSRVLSHMGRLDEAKSMALNAFEVIKQKPQVNNPELPALILIELARQALDQGDRDQAKAFLLEGLGLAEKLDARGIVSRSSIETLLSQLFLIDGRLDEALKMVKGALVYYRQQFPIYAKMRLDAEMLEAVILARQGEGAKAYEQAKPLVIIMRTRLLSPELSLRGRSELAEIYRTNFARFVDIALSAQDQVAAFQALQLSSFSENAVIAHMMARAQSLQNHKARTLFLDLEAKQAVINRLEREKAFALGKSERAVNDAQAALEEAKSALKLVSTALEKEVPDYKKLTQPSPLSIDQAMGELAPNEALLLPVSLDDRLLVVNLTKKGLGFDVAPIGSMALKTYIEGVLLSLNPHRHTEDFDQTGARALGQAIFTKKTLTQLKGIDELSVMGAGHIMRLPLSMMILSNPGTKPLYAIDRFGFSVKTTLVSRPLSEKKVSGFAGIGAPLLEGQATFGALPSTETFYRGGVLVTDLIRRLPQLPLAQSELEQLKKAFDEKESLLLTGRDATETKVKTTELLGYEVIAFATHGLKGGNISTLNEPSLVLTPPLEASLDDDGLLSASEVAGLKLNARWVILSACDSASGREASGPVYSGLAQGFMQAGAQNLLVSLWPVRDDVAYRLSIDTLNNYKKGLSKPQALRKAMLELKKNKKIPKAAHPAIWAPFSLIQQ